MPDEFSLESEVFGDDGFSMSRPINNFTIRRRQMARVSTPHRGRHMYPRQITTESGPPLSPRTQTTNLLTECREGRYQDVPSRMTFRVQLPFLFHYNEPPSRMVNMSLREDHHPRDPIPEHPRSPQWTHILEIPFTPDPISVYRCRCEFCIRKTEQTYQGHSGHLWAFIAPQTWRRFEDDSYRLQRTILLWLCGCSPLPNWLQNTPSPMQLDHPLIPLYSGDSMDSHHLNFLHFSASPDPMFRGRVVFYLPRRISTLQRIQQNMPQH